MGRDGLRPTRELVQRGLEHYASGRLKDAMADWETVVRIDPGDNQAAKLLAFARHKLKQLEGTGGASRRDTLESPIPQYLAVLTAEESKELLTPEQGQDSTDEDWDKADTDRYVSGGAQLEGADHAADTTPNGLPGTPAQGVDLVASARGLISECRAALNDRRADAAALAAEMALQLGERAAPPGLDYVLQPSRALFERAFRACVGDTRSAPIRALPAESLPEHGFDHRAAFLMSRMDGILSVADLLDIAGMPRFEALRMMAALRRAHAVDLVPGPSAR